jgi:hypothetical protein
LAFSRGKACVDDPYRLGIGIASPIAGQNVFNNIGPWGGRIKESGGARNVKAQSPWHLHAKWTGRPIQSVRNDTVTLTRAQLPGRDYRCGRITGKPEVILNWREYPNAHQRGVHADPQPFSRNMDGW